MVVIFEKFMSILKDRKFVFENRKPYHSKTRDLGVFSAVKKCLESVQFHRRSKKSLKMWLFCSEVLNAIESSMPNAWKALKAEDNAMRTVLSTTLKGRAAIFHMLLVVDKMYPFEIAQYTNGSTGQIVSTSM